MTHKSETLLQRYRAVRSMTDLLCEPLEPEDFVIQSMDDTSPTKWHLAHTTWFFETFVLKPSMASYKEHHPQYNFLFNSYYQTVGHMFARPHRGLLSRPTVKEVFAYRAHVDSCMSEFLASGSIASDVAEVVEIGLHHEQQHQELLVTDIKHMLSCNPLCPVYREQPDSGPTEAPPLSWVEFAEGLSAIGHEGEGFIFDNEAPRHRVFLHGFKLASRLATVGDYLEFMEDGGYNRFDLWLSEGWHTAQDKQWQAPLYWRKDAEGQWHHMTLAGLKPLDPNAPVCHVSYFEADAFARWSKARLASEAEWEVASTTLNPREGNFVEDGFYHPKPAPSGVGLQQMFGDVWEWTSSPYTAYPGYKPLPGALGEYNGKFMCNQLVLRGGSCATSRSHIRATYRNFFPSHARWQFMGIRLASDL